MEDPRKTWLEDNPGELPHEVADEVESMGGGDIPTWMIRDLLEDDPDMFGDFDAFQ